MQLYKFDKEFSVGVLDRLFTDGKITREKCGAAKLVAKTVNTPFIPVANDDGELFLEFDTDNYIQVSDKHVDFYKKVHKTVVSVSVTTNEAVERITSTASFDKTTASTIDEVVDAVESFNKIKLKTSGTMVIGDYTIVNGEVYVNNQGAVPI